MDGPATTVQALAKPSLGELLAKYDKQSYALLLVVCYVIGFITLNAHLATMGITDFEVFSPRIVLASADCLIYLACFWLGAGYTLACIDRESKRLLDHANSMKLTKKWEAFASAVAFSEIPVSFCFSASLFVFALIEPATFNLFWLYLIPRWIFIVIGKRCSNTPRRTIFWFIVNFIYNFAGVGIFIFDAGSTAISAFSNYIGLYVLFLFVLDLPKKLPTETLENVAAKALFITIYCLVVVGAFGSTLYGKINPKFGGGQPIPVQMIFSDGFIKSLSPAQAVSMCGIAKGDLVLETDGAYYLLFGQRTARVRTSDVAVVYYPRPDAKHDPVSGWLHEHIKPH